MIRNIINFILDLFRCRHVWEITDQGMDCFVECCCKCGAERYTTKGDAWGT